MSVKRFEVHEFAAKDLAKALKLRGKLVNISTIVHSDNYGKEVILESVRIHMEVGGFKAESKS